MQALTMQILAALLPILGPMLPGVLKSDGFSAQANSFIAYAVLIAVSLVQAWAAGSLGLNFYADAGIVLGIQATLLSGVLSGLDQYLQTNVGIRKRRLVL